MCSDHFAPWSERQGAVGVRLVAGSGAALQATSLRLGVVNAPGQRYHPAIIAQAARDARRRCTRAGSGLRSASARRRTSTSPVTAGRARMCGTPRLRRERRRDAAALRRRRGEHGRPRDRRPGAPVDPAGDAAAAAGGSGQPGTAAWAAEWADGLATVAQAPEDLERMVDAYRGAGGQRPARAAGARELRARPMTRRSPSPTTSGAPTSSLRRSAGTSTPPRPSTRRPSTSRRKTCTQRSSSPPIPAWHAEQARRASSDLGFDEIYLHHVGVDQSEFIDVFGDQVLPQFARTEAGA